MTKEELMKIAGEVMDGKRPESDLAKYGITLGPVIEGDAAKELLLNELEELWAEDESPDTTPGPSNGNMPSDKANNG